MKKKVYTVFIVDDEEINIALLEKILVSNGMQVVPAVSGQAMFERLTSAVPDLFLLDVQLEDTTGLALCRQLKAHPQFSDIPVIFLTAKNTAEDVAAGFEAGAVDYIVKPFNRMEVLARVQTHLRLHQALVEIEQLRQLALDANPLTQLPGNNTIKKTIEEKLKQQAAVTVVYCDLDNFKGFNDYYGFAAGDQALKFTAACLRNCLREMAPDQYFLGNIGGDDFVFIAPSENIQAVADRIAAAFDEGILDFYSAEDRQRGFILVKNRQDVMTQYPIMTISMAGVDLATAPYDHFLQVTYACSEMKHVSKKIAGSKLVLDRRRRPAA